MHKLIFIELKIINIKLKKNSLKKKLNNNILIFFKIIYIII